MLRGRDGDAREVEVQEEFPPVVRPPYGVAAGLPHVGVGDGAAAGVGGRPRGVVVRVVVAVGEAVLGAGIQKGVGIVEGLVRAVVG